MIDIIWSFDQTCYLMRTARQPDCFDDVGHATIYRSTSDDSTIDEYIVAGWLCCSVSIDLTSYFEIDVRVNCVCRSDLVTIRFSDKDRYRCSG